ncbi:MAG: hypothetical protein KKH04_03405 [Proteobacteria bacterium]|nr:hypothetical protein [Pseudomonadota bacterium]
MANDVFFLVFFSVVKVENPQAAPRVSENTEACLGCHATVTPGIVYDWRRSDHSSVIPEEAQKKGPKAKKVSSEKLPDKLKETVVGCAECHTLNPAKHTYFLLLSALSVLVWAAAMGTGGYLFGNFLRVIVIDIKHYWIKVFWVLAIIGGLIWGIYRYRSKRNRKENAKKEIEGGSYGKGSR